MKSHPFILTMLALNLIGGPAAAQMQYDSLGMPTPRPNQNVSPANELNRPIPNPPGEDASAVRSTKPEAAVPSTTGQNPNVSAGTAGTDKTNGLTPSGLTPD